MDPIKKASIVINEYLSDFLESLTQLPTKDMDLVRQIVGHWPLVKQLLKPFTAQAMKDEALDSEYVKAVMEDFRKATMLLDKLESMYNGVLDFDLEGIKTHTEPLMKMIERSKEGEQPQEEAGASPAPEEAVPEESPEEMPEETEKMSSVSGKLDQIASEIEKESPVLAIAIDKVSDQIDGKR